MATRFSIRENAVVSAATAAIKPFLCFEKSPLDGFRFPFFKRIETKFEQRTKILAVKIDRWQVAENGNELIISLSSLLCLF